MFSSGPNYSKLKTNLRLSLNRLKLLEKKNTELALKARKEIADYIAIGKPERAKIRVEQIIREDYLVEAMELLEMYCDLLLARFGLIQQMNTLDEGLAESISSLIWVAPRMQADVAELKIIADQLSLKYGKVYSTACRDNSIGTVAPKLMHKLSVQAPPKILVEKYLIEIAKNYNVPYEPDPQVMREDAAAQENLLIDFSAMEASKAAGAMGVPGWAPPPGVGWVNPYADSQPPYPGCPPVGPAHDMSPPPPYGFPAGAANAHQNQFNIPPFNDMGRPNNPTSSNDSSTSNTNDNLEKANVPKPSPRTKFSPSPPPDFDLPDLPSVPFDNLASSSASGSKGDAEDDIDFDDLTRRFEELKKKK